MAVFEDLNTLNINGHTEKKKVEGKELTYLSWPWAWAEVKKRYPDAHYTIWKNENGLPYTEDPMTGYMVFTSVTIDEVTHEMWLPVMNGANRAMKRAPYKYTTKFGEKSVEAATMMDINKTIMRCLVKNLAMFGLGLYIYAGEDLPEVEKEEAPEPEPVKRQSAPATVNTQAKVPEKQPEQPETPGAYMKRKVKEFKQQRADFDFAAARNALIAGKVVEDIPSATMNMDQAITLMAAIEKNFMAVS